jgi:hypothetical protein
MDRKSTKDRARDDAQSPPRARAGKATVEVRSGRSKTPATPKRAPSEKGERKTKATAKPRTDAASAGTKVRAKAAPTSPADVLTRLRAACLALPETEEKEAWQTPTFRVRGKMFAMFADDHHGDGRVAVWCKAPVGAQEALVESDPEHFFRPPYVGPSGWIGVRLDRRLDWDEIADLLREGWRVAAPKKLAAALAAASDD